MRLIKKKLILPVLAIATLLATSLTVQASTELPRPQVKVVGSSEVWDYPSHDYVA